MDVLIEVFVQHFSVNEDRAWVLADFTLKRSYGNPEGFYDKSDDIRNLENIERSLIEISRILSLEGLTFSTQELLHYKSFERQRSERASPDNGTGSEQKLRDNRFIHMLDFNNAIPALIEDIRSTKTDISKSEYTLSSYKKINWEAVNLVDAARDCWNLEFSKQPPSRALNPASKFGAFLEDLFIALDVKGNPKAAFRAWAKLHKEQ